jgi:hypothetical protein
MKMPQLYMLTLPGLDVKCDWRAVHDRLLDDFDEIEDVLATTMAGTLLVVFRGDPDVDGWLDGVSEAVLSRQLSAGRRRLHGHNGASVGARADIRPNPTHRLTQHP